MTEFVCLNCGAEIENKGDKHKPGCPAVRAIKKAIADKTEFPHLPEEFRGAVKVIGDRLFVASIADTPDPMAEEFWKTLSALNDAHALLKTKDYQIEELKVEFAISQKGKSDATKK